MVATIHWKSWDPQPFFPHLFTHIGSSGHLLETKVVQASLALDEDDDGDDGDNDDDDNNIKIQEVGHTHSESLKFFHLAMNSESQSRCLIHPGGMRQGSRASLCPLHPYRGLEGGVELGEKVGPASRASASQGQHTFLHQGAVHIIILYNHVFLQDLDGVELIGAPTLGQHHLETQAPKAQSIVGTLGVQVPAPPFQRHRNGNPRSFLSLSGDTLPTTPSGKASVYLCLPSPAPQGAYQLSLGTQ